MAQRRKRIAGDRSASTRAFAVVVEELRGHFKAFGERLDGLESTMTAGFTRVDERLAGIDGRLDVIDGRLDVIDGRLDGIDGRLDGIDGRLDGIDGRLDGIDGRIDRVEAPLAGLVHDVGLIKAAVLEQGRTLKAKVSRDEVEAIVERAVTRTKGA